MIKRREEKMTSCHTCSGNHCMFMSGKSPLLLPSALATSCLIKKSMEEGIIKMKIKYKHYCGLVTKSHLTLLRPHGLYPARLLCPWDFPRQAYWSGLSFPPPGDLPYPGIKPTSLALAGGLFTTEPPRKPSFLL